MGDNAPKRRTLARFIHGPGRLLEIGCATGNVASAFEGLSYVGVDIDRQAISLARRKFPATNYRFHCLDILAEELPEEPGFDYVLLSHAAHHLPDEYLCKLLRRSAELLNEGGSLVVLDMIRPEPDEPRSKQFFYRLDRGTHFRNLEEFREVFSRETKLEEPEFHVIEMRKMGIEIIDDVVILAKKRLS
ncbi:MAG: class I SAM-dependent methyltransferase [Myxococcota bacterium]